VDGLCTFRPGKYPSVGRGSNRHPRVGQNHGFGGFVWAIGISATDAAALAVVLRGPVTRLELLVGDDRLDRMMFGMHLQLGLVGAHDDDEEGDVRVSA
jgi:hypothetical protein